MGNNDDPQSLHKYAYTHQDPVNGLDPSGHYTLAEMLVTIAIVAVLGASFGGAIFKATGGSALKGAILGAIAGTSLTFAYFQGRLVYAFVQALLQGAGQAAIDALYGYIVKEPPGYALWQSFFAGFSLGAAAAAFENASIPAPVLAGLLSFVADMIDGIGSKKPYDWSKILTNLLVTVVLSYFIPLAIENAVPDGPEAEKLVKVSRFIAQDPMTATEFLAGVLGTFVGSAIGLLYKEATNLNEIKR